MRLIGMLDSPYVRRVAISLRRLAIDFEHEPLSVFSTFAEFQAINPVVKAPTLVCDDGEVLMDSTLILDYLEARVGAGNGLLPATLPARLHSLRLIGLSLVACEKTVQIVYERELRPQEKRHEPWLSRVDGQLRAAYAELEHELERQPLRVDERIDQAGITLAVSWNCTRKKLGDAFDVTPYPRLAAFSAEAEALALFRQVTDH